jgi:hypothetical protein
MDTQEIRDAMAVDESRLGGPSWRPREDFEWRMLVGGRGSWRRWADKLYGCSSSTSASTSLISSSGSSSNSAHNFCAVVDPTPKASAI